MIKIIDVYDYGCHSIKNYRTVFTDFKSLLTLKRVTLVKHTKVESVSKNVRT